jgi:hypothetical protein
MRNPGVYDFPRRMVGIFFSANDHPAPGGAAHTRDDLGQLALAVSGDPRKTQYLAFPDGKGDPLQGRFFVSRKGLKVFDIQHNRIGSDRFAFKMDRRVLTKHELYQFGLICLGRLPGPR